MQEGNSEEKPLILIPLGSILDSCWMRDYTPSGYIEFFCEWQLVVEFVNSVVFNGYDSVIGFGRHEGLTVKEIFEIDGTYIEFCMRELGQFYLKSEVIIDLINKGYVFSDETTLKYREKLQDFKSGVYFNNKHIEELESRSDYGDDDEDGWGGDVNSNPHYNDDLDMDQQSQEFWDN